MTFHIRKPMGRRDFLRGLGAATAMAPFLPLLQASAAGDSYPTRLVLFFTPHATFWPEWLPQINGSQHTFRKILAPLTPYKSKINVLRGVGMVPSRYFVAHTPGGTQIWTGSELDRGPQNGDGSYQYGANTGLSVDQVIAARIGNRTSYRSLQFGAWTGQTTIYSGANAPVFPAQDPQQTFSRLFTQLSSGTLTARQSVLDVVAKQLTTMQSRLGVADKTKVDAHLTAVRDLEQRLQHTSTCQGPMLTPGASDPSGIAAMCDLMVGALSCDLTRVVSLQFGQQDNDGGPYPFLNISAGHHPLTHLAPSDAVDENGNNVSDQTRSINGQLTSIYHWYAQMFAALLARMDAVQEGSGTMLDHSLVIWGSELADYGSHAFAPSVPFVLAGGGNGALATGRYIDLSGTPQVHNRLLVSACNVMGLTDIQRFGNMDPGSGPLTAL